jgi:uncharacterized protein YukE
MAALADTAGLRRFAAVLQTASAHLTSTCAELDAQVSNLVWTGWNGAASMRFQMHWKTEQGKMLWLSRDSATMATILVNLAGELDVANAMAASSTPGAWASALAFARVAWAQATAELSAIIVTPITDPSFSRNMSDLGTGIVDLVTGTVTGLIAALKWSPQRQLTDPEGFANDMFETGQAQLEAARQPGSFGKAMGSLIGLEDLQSGHGFKALPSIIFAVTPFGGEAKLASTLSTKAAIATAKTEAARLGRLAIASPEAMEELRLFYRSQPDDVLKALKGKDPMAASVYDERIPANTELQGIIEGDTPRPPHYATFTYRDANGELTTWDSLRSGNMTEQESALGYPFNTQATHTEIRALNAAPLGPDGELSIVGQYNPCVPCQTAMIDASKSGATVRYWWPGGEFSAQGGVGSFVYR